MVRWLKMLIVLKIVCVTHNTDVLLDKWWSWELLHKLRKTRCFVWRSYAWCSQTDPGVFQLHERPTKCKYQLIRTSTISFRKQTSEKQTSEKQSPCRYWRNTRLILANGSIALCNYYCICRHQNLRWKMDVDCVKDTLNIWISVAHTYSSSINPHLIVLQSPGGN